MTIRVHDDWLLTPYRLAVHEPTATAVIADVHLGYREARRQTGDAIPLLDVATQLSPLDKARRRFAFDKLIVAGDLFERGARQELFDRFLHELEALSIALAGFVPGNHDRGWEALQPAAAVVPHGILVGTWRIVHGDASPLADLSGVEKVVAGHWHPAVRHQGRRVPCYLVGANMLILPAFSADAAGWSSVAERSCHSFQRVGIVNGRVIDCGCGPTRRATKNPRTSAVGRGL